MGVKGLWRLLLPIGRRISIETLEGRTLAIDASIWLTQFLKANRDPDTGAVRPGAHLIGFLRRICKLLFHGIRPVFVFDGATPEIKLREVRARRERRERMTIGVGAGTSEDDGAIKRMARKLLVAQLKKKKELEAAASAKGGKSGTKSNSGQPVADANDTGAFSSTFNLGDDEEDDENNNDTGGGKQADIAKDTNDRVENSANETDPPAAEDDIIDLSTLDNGAEYSRGGNDDDGQNDWDNAKPPGLFGSDDSSSSSSEASMQIPENEDQLDIDAILALPADQRKDVIEKAKRQQRLRSRKEFMPAAANPEAYSQVQLKNFLRSSNLNKKINEMGTKAAKKGVGPDGLEGEAIASDATRRFIFVKDDQRANEKSDSGNNTNGSNRGLASISNNEDKNQEFPGHRVAGAGKSKSDDSDDDDVFGNEMSTSAGASSRGRDRAIYSSSDDEDEAGGFVVDDDPKRINYKSHKQLNSSGWTLDEQNVFDAADGRNVQDASNDEGGGFSPEEAPTLSISRHNETQNQMHEDEMLARALQEAEEEDALSADASQEDGFLVGRSEKNSNAHEKKTSSRRQEESDAILAVQLQAQEQEQTQGDKNIAKNAPSVMIDLSGDQDIKETGKRETIVLDVESDNSSVEEVAVIRQGKRRRGGGPKKKVIRKDSSDDEDNDDIAWEDGDSRPGEIEEPLVDMPIAKPQKLDKEILKSPEAHGPGDEEIDWEDGDAQDGNLEEDESQEEDANASANEQKAAVLVSGRIAEDVTPSEHAQKSQEGSDTDNVEWQDGDEDAATENTDSRRMDESRHSRRKSSMSEADVEIQDEVTNDFFVSPAKNANIAALKHAEETASNLTNWAGRAVRRAIAAHMEDSRATNAEDATAKADFSSTNKESAGIGTEIVIGDSSEDGEIDDEIEELRKHPTDGTSSAAMEVENEVEIVDPCSTQSESAQGAAAVPAIASPVNPSKPSINIGDTSSPTPVVASDSIRPSTAPQNTSHFMDTSLEALQQEHAVMQSELNRQQRDMDQVTEEMKEEIIQLLQLFGIPYIEAPAEAEAQACALESLGLVDGVVTEDSDAFVFGGKKVYKNIFDDQKYVEVYFASDAERDLGLSHNHMIALACLLGGDYTEGVKGVGIVNGMEVLQAFDVSEDIKAGLTKFREWLDGFEPTDDFASRSAAEKEFHRKHRTARGRWTAPKDFPSPSVLTAYQKPVVDRSDARFSWGLPDIEALRAFCFQKIGWPFEDTDKVLSPVMKSLESAGTRQTRLESYFMRYEDDIKFASVKSKRLQTVLKKVKGGSDGGGSGGSEREDNNLTGAAASSAPDAPAFDMAGEERSSRPSNDSNMGKKRSAPAADGRATSTRTTKKNKKSEDQGEPVARSCII